MGLTPERRVEITREICRRVATAVAKVAPPGLGRWDRAWELVEEPSAALLDLLYEWESSETDSPEERAAIEASANEVVRAWRLAAEEFQRAGEPTRAEEATCT